MNTAKWFSWKLKKEPYVCFVGLAYFLGKNNIIEIKNKQLLQARTSIEKSTCFTKTFYATKHIFYSKPIDKIWFKATVHFVACDVFTNK